MKRIHFDNTRDWRVTAILIVAVIFILLGSFEPFDFDNPNMNKGITLFGWILWLVYFGRMFLYKNYVQWNKKGISIKINSFWGKNLTYNNIKGSEIIDNDTLIITKNNGNQLKIDLQGIVEKDALKLHNIIAEHSLEKKV